MSSQRENSTSREWASDGESERPRLHRRNIQLLDDLESLAEQTNSAREYSRAPSRRSPGFDSSDQLPPSGQHAPRPTPSDQKRTTEHYDIHDAAVKTSLTRVRSRLRSRQGDDVETFPAGLRFLRQRPEQTQEVASRSKNPERRGVALLGYATLVLISAGGISFAAVQLLSSRAPNIKPEETRTTGIGDTTLAINQPAAMAMPRLRLTKVNEVGSKPILLGISVENARPDSFILLRGLPPGSSITKGWGTGRDGWRVPVQDLANAMLSPPQNFTGTMALSVDLKIGDDAVADSEVHILNWSSPEAKLAPSQGADAGRYPRVSSLQDQLPIRSSTDPEPVRSLTPAQSANERQRPGAIGQPARQMPQSSIASLLSRADSALGIGDIAAARLLLRRAAEAGEVKAAMSLASTYDPAVLRRLRTLGAQADIAEARRWYERAAELGSAEAMQRLKDLH